LVILGAEDLNYKPFWDKIIRKASKIQGIAMSLSGSSRPCSEVSTLISHAIDLLGMIGNGVLHGIQVASISLFILFLQDKIAFRKYPVFQKSTGIPFFVHRLLNFNRKSCTYRYIPKSKEMSPVSIPILGLRLL